MKKDIDKEVSGTKNSKLHFKVDTNSTKLSEIMYMRMKEKNMTQREFAERIGVTEVSVSRYMRGDRMPRGEVLAKIVKVLNISWGDIANNFSDNWYVNSKMMDILEGLEEDEQLELLSVMEYWAKLKRLQKSQNKVSQSKESKTNQDQYERKEFKIII